MSGTGPGQAVTGFIANSNNPFDPVAAGYPASNPTTGFTPKDESFAGIIHAHPPGGGADLSLYCIDINTLTYGGIGYVLGTWDASTVPNVDYVGRLLTEYYPNTNDPAALTDLNQKAAAVQAAIWFFTDRYVLNTSDSLHDTVAAIVGHIIDAGPLKQQPPPSLTITPPQLSGPAGSVLGPFTVNTGNGGQSAPPATVTATGGEPRRRRVAKGPELRLQIFMLGRHRREQTIRVSRGEIAAGLRIPRTDENRPAAPPWLRLRHHRLQFVVVTIEVERLIFGPDAFNDGQPLLAVVIASVMLAQRDSHHTEFDRIPAGDDVEPESPVADVIRRDHLLGGKNRIDERDVECPKSRNVFRRSQ